MVERARTVVSARGRARRRAAAVAVGAVLLAGACSPSSDGAVADGGSDWVPGPLEEMLDAVRGPMLSANPTQQEAEAFAAAQHRLQEEIIAACMAELGFDYIPREPHLGVQLSVGGALTPGDVAWGSREFAARFGFGISTADLLHEAPAEPAPPPPDPNAERLEAMSPAEREEWDRALFGDPAPGAFGPEELPQKGCWGYSMYRLWAVSEGDDGQFAALAAEADGHRDRVNTDPRVVALVGEWAACMTEAGHPGLRAPGLGDGGLTTALWDEWNLLNGWGDAHAEMLAAWDWEVHPDGPEWLHPSPERIAEFTEREIALAVADFDCRESLDFEARRRAVDLDLQQQFVDRHGPELEAWALHAAERRAG